MPDAESAEHSSRVTASLRRLIADSGGSISFGEYMQHVLYAPGLGYYASGAVKFGEHGDFVTAPEISPLFARVVARQCAAVADRLGHVELLEVGAGSGRLAADLLGKLAEMDRLPRRYYILEVSPELAERQQRLIEAEQPSHRDRVSWLDGWPERIEGVIIANEVADALPVERFLRQADGVLELRVLATDDGFALGTGAASASLEAAVQNIEASLGHRLPDGYRSEVSLGLSQWIGELARVLHNGIALVFDYGVSRREYYADGRDGGWLRCHFRHHAHPDPFLYPGVQDLSAWVDFTAIAEAAATNGLDVCGYVTQAAFLLHGGLGREVASMMSQTVTQQVETSGQLRKLTLPGEMGEHFKCMCLGRGDTIPLDAFASADMAHRL